MDGQSYSEISRLLKISKSTLSGWFAGLELPEEAREKINKKMFIKSREALNHRNAAKTREAEQNALRLRQLARKEITQLSQKDILALGALLYWAEGYKRPVIKDGKAKTYHSVKLSSSDPGLIRLFLRFLREACGIPNEKIGANLRAHAHQNSNQLLDFWNRQTGISYSKMKIFIYKSSGNKQFFTPPYGTVQIIVNNTGLYHRIMGLIDGLGNLY